MAFEILKAKKKELGYSNQYISAKTGISTGTIQKFFSGVTKAPRQETIQVIEELLLRPGRQTTAEEDTKIEKSIERLKKMRKEASSGMLRYDESRPYFDYSDCLLRDRAGKLEVIEGQLFIRHDECPEHSLMIGEIMIQLDSYIEAKRKRDMVIINPVDVFLNIDSETVVHPDISVLRNRHIYEDKMIFGAPDLIIEVVTPKSSKTDRITKFYRYGQAGVREYWMVELMEKQVTVHDLERMGTQVYSFEDEIPVAIWNQEFSVDFSLIREKLDDLKNW